MRTIAYLSVSALLWMGLGYSHDEKSSRMVLRVEKAQAATAEKALAGIKGIKSVKYDPSEEKLIILYDKPTLGCCSRIHSALKEAGIEYKLISNEEYPACKDKHEGGHSHSDASAPIHKTSGKHPSNCCKKAKASSCSSH